MPYEPSEAGRAAMSRAATERWVRYREQPLEFHRDRFMRRIAIDPLHPDGCWEWSGEVNDCGYGLFSINRVARLAHRVAYELLRGMIEDGLCVLHHCDNPPCIAPHHLWLGTQADNTRDKIAKGRATSQPGESNGNARLTEAQVRRLRARYVAGGISIHELAHELGVSSEHISRIVRNRAWRLE